MNIIESKNADLIISKDNTVDLYDEQIDANKSKTEENEKLIQSLLGKLSTIETYTNNIETRINNIETNTSVATNSVVSQMKSDIINAKNAVSDIRSAIEKTKTDMQTLRTDVDNNRGTINNINSSITTINNTLNGNLEKLNLLDDKYNIVNNNLNVFKQTQENYNLSNDTTVSGINDNIKLLKNRADNLQSGIETINATILQLQQSGTSSYEGRITNIEVANRNLTRQINEMSNKFDDFKNTITSYITPAALNVYTKDEINSKLATIKVDAYTKAEMDSKLTPNALNVYTKTEIDSKLATIKVDAYTKAEMDSKLTPNALNVYTKTEIDSKLAGVVAAPSASNNKVNKSGDTMTGALTVPSIKINGNKGNFLSGFRMDEQDWISIINNKGLRTNASMKADGGFLGRATTAGRADSSARADNANNADRATYTEKVANGYRNMRFNWNRQSGQPPWLWGGSDGENMFIYNPSNFNVNHATTADTAVRLANNKLIFNNGTELWIE